MIIENFFVVKWTSSQERRKYPWKSVQIRRHTNWSYALLLRRPNNYAPMCEKPFAPAGLEQSLIDICETLSMLTAAVLFSFFGSIVAARSLRITLTSIAGYDIV